MSQVLSSVLTNAQYNSTRGCANGLPDYLDFATSTPLSTSRPSLRKAPASTTPNSWRGTDIDAATSTTLSTSQGKLRTSSVQVPNP
ncbi:MAG: hypothetical protein V7K54_09470 [Nostoc sp.]